MLLMKIKFKEYAYQNDAIAAVVQLFAGQEQIQDAFVVDRNPSKLDLLLDDNARNNLRISHEALLRNLHEVQKKHSLPQTNDKDAIDKSFHASIEMETATGKTYVFTRTIMELNKKYGFKKFIIIVPSRSIREGVYNSLQLTQESFSNQYNSVPYRYFIYDSTKLSDVRQFATADTIEIMIINIDAFNKSENVINQQIDRLHGETAMNYIRDVRPIVIIDEPQSVNNTIKAKEAIASLNPLCVFRYSATHREKINPVYRLTAVDALRLGLVKQIAAASTTVSFDHNKPYIYLKSVSQDNGFSAKVEIDVENKKAKVIRKIITVKPNDNLYVLAGHRDLYNGYTIAGIDCTPGKEQLEFTNGETLKLGRTIGGVDELILKRAQIRRTIEIHLDKELCLFEKGIKVLSLFFIDEVAKYRLPDGSKGIYAQIFEECYNELMSLDKYAPLKKKFNTAVEKAHNGYFAQDKKGIYKNTTGDTQADDDIYNTIMKDKAWLLSFECPLRFIFSHSALKEGWDNPNVFQVCTLLEQKSVFTCRQKVGRGLRLCVNQDGERIEDREINSLHVIASESYAEFAATLQKEIETETGLKFGVLQLEMFIGRTYEEPIVVERKITEQEAVQIVETLKSEGVIDSAGTIQQPEKAQTVMVEKLNHIPAAIKTEVQNLVQKQESISVDALTNKTYEETVIEERVMSYEDAMQVMETLIETKVVSKEGKIKDTMKAQLEAGTLNLSERFTKSQQRLIEDVLLKAENKFVVRDASKDVVVKLKKQVIVSPEFMELWNKIKQKTTYRVRFDEEELIRNASKELAEMEPIPTARLVSTTAEIDIRQSGVEHKVTYTDSVELDKTYTQLPNVFVSIANKTLLSTSLVAKIIRKSGRAADYLKNPQAFAERALEIIERNRHEMAIDGIKYMKLAGEEYYVQEIFDSSELLANLDKNAVAVNHSVYDYIMYDSSVESRFAIALDNDPDVKMFFKLPERFKIRTPIGTYNPDWAVFLEKNGVQKMYFVLETKGKTDKWELRKLEELKVHCAKRHFQALDEAAVFSEKPVTDWHEFKQTI